MSDPNDPHSPEYQPDYTGSDPSLGGVGPVGNGGQFGADLYQLYKAGRLKLPELAELYYDLATEVHRTHGPSHHAFDSAGKFQRPHQLWMELRDELQEVLGQTSTTLAETGQALVEIADSYVRTDEEALQEFNRLLERYEDEYQSQTPSVSTPPRPEDYAPEPIETYPMTPV